MEDVETLCDRVIIINHGLSVYDGALEKLIDQYVDQKILEVTFKEDVSKETLAKFGEVKEFTAQRALIEVKKGRVKEAAIRILSDLPVDDILINEVPIDDVIRRIFTEKRAQTLEAAQA